MELGGLGMDFIAVLTTFSPTLVQGGYICLLIWVLVRYIPKLNEDHAKERAEREDKFLTVIDSYREALEKFQEKEDASHQQLIQMVSECRSNTAKEHAELMRALRAIAKKTNAEIFD